MAKQLESENNQIVKDNGIEVWRGEVVGCVAAGEFPVQVSGGGGGGSPSGAPPGRGPVPGQRG